MYILHTYQKNTKVLSWVQNRSVYNYKKLFEVFFWDKFQIVSNIKAQESDHLFVYT